MAITITPEIQGQQVSSVASYCYLYEPFRVFIRESDNTALKIYIDLELRATDDASNLVKTIGKIGEYDLNPGVGLGVDLMKIAQQEHNAELYRFGTVDDIVSSWEAIVSKYRYVFKIYSDKTTSPTTVLKIPIIGGRDFDNFTPVVGSNLSLLTEFNKYSVNIDSKWNQAPLITATLVSPTLQDSTPVITKNISVLGKDICGGFLIWKSRYGGWSTWGFELKTERHSHNYVGKLDVGMFSSTLDESGQPYIDVDYTSITTSYSRTLRSLSLSSEELLAVNGINATTAVYYTKDSNKLELMRLSTATVPISSNANGGDVSVRLDSISKVSQQSK